MHYVDLQINGYAGVDFNQDDLTAAQLRSACRQLAAGGVEAILATIITDTTASMERRLANIVRHREADPLIARLIVGIHIEGPFLNPTDGYRGAHPADAIRPASPDVMNRLLDAGGGLTRLVTLAPEQDRDMTVTRMLCEQGIVVAAGHSDASLDELRAALDAGLSLYTHLGNGCPMLLPRHDNIIQRVLSMDDRLRISFIADGVHVPFHALKNYLRCAGLERCLVVTDAVAPAGLGPGLYRLGRWEMAIGEDMVSRAPDGSHLIGAAITMRRTHENLVKEMGLEDSQARWLLYDHPRRLLGLPAAITPEI
jgi:N-acetylglucosamine-6-phosphate deacetylase